MITLLRHSERRHVRRGEQEAWSSVWIKDHPAPIFRGIGFLVAFDELRLAPGNSTEPHVDNEAEVITYVYRGALSQQDTAGNSGVVHAGEFQRMSTGRLILHKETCVAESGRVHLFRISLRPSVVGIDREQEQTRFTVAQRRNLICVVASPDGRKGSLRIHQDALVYSSILATGYHLVHQLEPGRRAWLHMVCGEVVINDLVLTRGDGAGVADEPSVSITAREDSEILLVDLHQSETTGLHNDRPA